MVTAAHINAPIIRDQEERNQEEFDEENLYPSSDGKPMGETDQHIIAMNDLLHMLRSHFTNESEVYIAGNNFIYYEQGDSNKCVSPDAYVVFGVPKHPRPIYKVWRENGRTPSVVFEITSRTTKRVDTTTKFLLYQNVLRVPEYFLFDPTGKTPREDRLQGFRLENGVYVAITPTNGILRSEQLGLDLHQDGNVLRLFDYRTEQHLRTADESFTELALQRMIAEQERLFAEEQQRIAEQERLFAEEQQRRAEQQQRIAEQERQLAQEQQQLAETQRERAERAEAELARLQAELEALRKQNQ